MQTIIDPENGDCFAACLASILELKLEDIPVYHGSGWLLNYDRWLSKWGMRLTVIDSTCIPPQGWHIISVLSANFEGVAHAVVGYDGEVKHDPSPANKPNKYTILNYIEFTIIDPAKARRKNAKNTH